MTPTEIEFAGRGTSGVWHIATDSVENLLLDLRDAVTVEDAHGITTRLIGHLFSSLQAANRAQCAAPDKPVGY